MTSPTTAPGLLLGELDLTYIKIGLKRLVEDYDSQGELKAATATRDILGRLDPAEPAQGMPKERHAHYQRSLMEAMTQGFESVEGVLREWYTELLLCDPKAANTLSTLLVQQLRAAGSHASLSVLHQAGTKLEALEKRHGTSVAVQQFGEWIAHGFGQLKQGQEPWAGDPDLVRP